MEAQASNSENSPPERVWPNGHQKALTALRRGSNYTQAAAKAGRTDDTLLDWRHADPDYAQAVDDAIAEARWAKLRRGEDLIDKAVTQGLEADSVSDVALKAAIQTVKSLGREVWGDKVQGTGENGAILVETIERAIVRP